MNKKIKNSLYIILGCSLATINASEKKNNNRSIAKVTKDKSFHAHRRLF